LVFIGPEADPEPIRLSNGWVNDMGALAGETAQFMRQGSRWNQAEKPALILGGGGLSH